MLNLRRVAIFREVARRGSFSAAATELSYSQAAVSHHVARLELELGARLLERDARGVAMLTPAGEVLLEAADRLLAGAEDVETSVAAAASAHALPPP